MFDLPLIPRRVSRAIPRWAEFLHGSILRFVGNQLCREAVNYLATSGANGTTLIFIYFALILLFLNV